MNHVEIWRRSVPGRGESTCKGPEAGLCLAQLRSKCGKGESRGDEVQILQGLVGMVRTWPFTLGEVGPGLEGAGACSEQRRDRI